MITATEARKITALSEATVEKYIALIESKIIAFSIAGKSKYPCYIEGLWKAMPTFVPVFYTQIQENVASKLIQFGYCVVLGKDGGEFVRHEAKADIEKYVNTCLIISW